MSDITYDWMPFLAQAATKLSTGQALKKEPYRREDEFRSALDRYMADYRKHHAEMNGAKARGTLNTRFTFFWRFANWSTPQVP
jgi:hypothetical protein